MIGQLWGWQNVPIINHANSETLFGTGCTKLIQRSDLAFTTVSSYACSNQRQYNDSILKIIVSNPFIA